jgi:hypothetical protein
VSKELVIHDDIDSDIRLAKALAQSGFYKDIRDAAAGVVKLRIARELGLGLKGISDVHIVEGKPTLSYQAILGMVRAYTGPHNTDRYSFRYLRRDEECVEIEWTINNEVIGVSKCDTEDAKRMGVASRGTWQKYPRQMRTARAVTEGVNAFMPEVIGGSIYTPDELGSGGSDDVVVVADEGGGRTTLQVASSQAAPAPSLTLKAAEPDSEHEDAVMSTNDRVDDMIAEAIDTMDAAEETLDGEVIDQSAEWVANIKAYFTSLPAEQKKAAVAVLRNGGYLPEDKITASKMYELLADTLGQRSMEIDLILDNLV